MNPLIARRARVTVKVTRSTDNPETGPTETTSYQFEQHRMSIQVSNGGETMGQAKVQIFGVPLDAMNKIARLWLEVLSPSNDDTLTIDVWDGSNFIPFFDGVITWSAVDASNVPNVALIIEAADGMVAQNTVAKPYAQDTPVSLRDALTAILEGTGIVPEFAETVPDLQARRIHLVGTPMDQVQTLMRGFPEVTWYVVLQRLIVRPANGPIDGPPLVVSKSTGMIGYPTYSTSGITVNMIFDPRVRPGLALDIQTIFDFVNRTKWVTAVLQHNLQPNTPGGQWVTSVAAQAFGSKGDTAGTQS